MFTTSRSVPFHFAQRKHLRGRLCVLPTGEGSSYNTRPMGVRNEWDVVEYLWTRRLRSGASDGVSVPRVLLARLSYVFSIAQDKGGYLDLRPKIVGRGVSGGDVECQWAAMKRNHPEIREFLRSRFGRPLDRKLTLTEAENDTLFGIVECDIHVLDPLKAHFSEMPLIFKNTEISRENIRPFMKAFAEDNSIMPKPRRSLIGSFFATKIMLGTLLLKWYLAHDLEVPKIYQVVEYTPKRCFELFGNAVSDARRDRYPDQAIIADTMKLVENSSYGKTITNQERHRNVEYCSEQKASQLVNEPYFLGLVMLTRTKWTRVKRPSNSISLRP